MSRPVWIEVALNGPWPPAKQPRMPVQVADIVREGVDCARAGAAIIHVHARDPETGAQRDDADLYAAIIEGIREQVDAIVYPTLPLAGATDHPGTDSAVRYAAVEELGRRGLLEWMVVDPGSVNFFHLEDLASNGGGFVYLNPGEQIRHGLEIAARYGAHPGYACYEPGFVRLGSWLRRAVAHVPMPIYRLMFSEQFAFGFPPAPYAVDAYLSLLAAEAPDAPWMAAGLGVDILPLVAPVVERGGHIRVGLEDAPFGSRRSNPEWVECAAAAVARAGGRPARVEEVRAGLRAAGA